MNLTPEEQAYQKSLMGGTALQDTMKQAETQPDVSFDQYARELGYGSVVDETNIKLQKEKLDEFGNAALKTTAGTPDGKADKAIGNPAKGFAMGVVDLAQTATNGMVDVADFMESTAQKLGMWSGDLINDSMKVNWSEKLQLPEDALGTRAMRSLTKYGAPVAATFAAGGGPAAALGVSALTDFLLIDPKQERLSDLLVNNVPELKNFPAAYNIVDALSNKKDDSQLAGRFKNMIEGLVVQAPMVGAGFWGVTKLSKKSADAAKAAESVTQVAPKTVAAEVKTTEQIAEEVKGLQQLDLFNYQATKIAQGGEVKFNLNNTNVVEYAAEFRKANPDGVLARGPKDFSELDAEAKTILENPEKLNNLLGWRLGDRPLTDAETKASQYLLRNSTDSVVDAARAYTKNGTKEDLVHLMNMMDTHGYINGVRGGAGSEAGRALNAHKVAAEMAGKSVDEFNQIMGAENRAKLLDDILKFSGGEDKIADTAKAIAALGDLSPEDAALAVEKMTMGSKGTLAKTSEVAKSMAYNSLLGIKSTVANHFNNGLTNMKRQSDNFLAATIGTLKGGEDALTYSQATSYLSSSISATLEGFMAMGTALRKGRGGPANIVKADFAAGGPKLLSDTLEIPVERNLGYFALGKIADTVGLAMSVPSRFNATADAFWGTVSYRGKLAELANSKVAEMGLEGAEASAMFKQIMKTPDADLHDLAKAHAEEMTFSKRMSPEEWGSSDASRPAQIALATQNLIEKLPMGEVVFPFFKTSANVMEYTVNNSPLALLIPNSNTMKAIRAGGKEADMAMAKVTTGSIALGISTYLASAGMYSGPDVRNPRIKQALAETDQGWQPDSISVNGNWVNIQRLDYTNSLLRLGSVLASTRNYISKDEYEQLAMVSASAVADFMTPEMMVDSYSRYMEYFSDIVKGNDTGKAVKSIAQDLGTRVNPLGTMQREVTQAFVDPFKADTAGYTKMDGFTEGLIAKYKAVNPWLSTDLPISRNMFGEPLLAPFGTLEEGQDIKNFISPFASHKKENSQLVKTLAKMNGFFEQMQPIDKEIPKLEISMPSRTFSYKGVSIDLNPVEYEKYVMYSAGLNLDGSKMGAESLRDSLSKVTKAILPNTEIPLNQISYRKMIGAVSKVIGQYKKLGQARMLADQDVMSKWTKAQEATMQLQDYSEIGE